MQTECRQNADITQTSRRQHANKMQLKCRQHANKMQIMRRQKGQANQPVLFSILFLDINTYKV